jgi:hypothetical protein
MASSIPLHSNDNTAMDIRHPMPDLQSAQGAYVGNIERLEEHAERMSESGSDLGEEIRKLQLEQKLSDSRRSSLLSAPPTEEPLRLFTTRSRNASTSSYTNSIVDVNGNARWGGYSPAGYITSPVGSLKSSSFAQHPPNLQRQRSSSKVSRLGQIVQTEEEEEETPASPASLYSNPEPQRDTSPLPTHRSVSSFTHQYDQITNDIHHEMGQDVVPEEHLDPEAESVDEMSFEYNPYADLPDRPGTAASTDTTHKMGILWQDFDGSHCPPTVPEEPEPEPEPPQTDNNRQSSLLKEAPAPEPRGVPPPDDNMVYYPAPVPRMLNLPQRLSKLPPADLQARRRTQLLEKDNRKSAAWPTDNGVEQSKPNRKSRQNLAGLPPQLRASAFFDQPAPAPEYEVRGETPGDALDNILAAGAHAPVSAFTDHTFAGHVGDEVYGREHKRKGSKAISLEKTEGTDNRKSRSSLNLLNTRRNSSGQLLNKLKKRSSSVDLNVLTTRAAESRMSLGVDLEQHDPDARGPEHIEQDTPRVQSFDGEEHAVDEAEDEEAELEEEMPFGPPTTLLAELQLRKQQQKTRKLTAANAFPNGMHSTLLELDAVAEIEQRKRRGQKVNLAWESQPAQQEDEDSDDNVPLGMLFPGRDGLANKRAGASAQQQPDWDRPVGLLAQRELENSEPLSRRRTRLVDNRMTRDLSRDPGLRASQSQLHLAVPTTTTPQPESEDEGETLGQRMRRMKDRQALDDALGDVRKSTISVDFASEMMSQFGVNEDEKPTPANDDEEETLGQRRARLQAESSARGESNAKVSNSRPPLRTSMSMADVLGAHPINSSNHARAVTDDALLAALPPGSLLHQSAKKQDKLRASRLHINRMSSFGNLNSPLLGNGMGKTTEDQPVAAKIQAYKDMIAGGAPTPMSAPVALGTPSMMFNGQMMPGVSPGMPGQRESYFPQANMGMMGMNGMGMGMMSPQMNMNMGMGGMQGGMGMGYPQMPPGMRQSSMMNMPPMQMGGIGLQQGMMMEQPMDPRQRAQIDRWRSSVMH